MSPENNHRAFVSLKDLLLNVQSRLKQSFPQTYWVKAEVAGIRKSGQHIYFDLIELQNGLKVAQVKANAFSGEGTIAIYKFERTTGQRFVNGLRIGAQVRINFHPVFGMSLILCAIDAELTLGGIELQRNNTLQKLLQEHPSDISFTNGQYQTHNTRLKLNLVLQRVAVVASVGSDGYEDFMHCINTNSYRYRFTSDIYPAVVHGANASKSIIKSMNDIARSGIPYDAIVLIRGGGSPADFMPFDDERLAILVAKCAIPVITGIGHHTNQGICDFFACVHTKTPTMAGQFLIDHNHLFETSLVRLSNHITEKTRHVIVLRKMEQEKLQSRLIAKSRYFLEDNRADLTQLSNGFKSVVSKLTRSRQTDLSATRQQIISRTTTVLKSGKYDLMQKMFVLNQEPFRLVKSERLKAVQLKEHLKIRVPQVLKNAKSDLVRLKQNFDNLDPEKILKRGFAIIKKDQSIIMDSSNVSEGDQLQIIQANSTINTTVININSRDGKANDL